MTQGIFRLRTPWLDLWRRDPTPPGTLLDWAAAWEQSAVIAHAQGADWDKVVDDLVEAELVAFDVAELVGLDVRDCDMADELRPEIREIVLHRQGILVLSAPNRPWHDPRLRWVGPSTPWKVSND
jgi:hypothetical protein